MISERFKMMIGGLDQSKLKAGADREPKNSNREVLWIIAGFLICGFYATSGYAATLAVTFVSTVFSNSGPVQLHGGYDCYFNQVVSFSTISGSITLSGAAEVEMANIVIK